MNLSSAGGTKGSSCLNAASPALPQDKGPYRSEQLTNNKFSKRVVNQFKFAWGKKFVNPGTFVEPEGTGVFLSISPHLFFFFFQQVVLVQGGGEKPTLLQGD